MARRPRSAAAARNRHSNDAHSNSKPRNSRRIASEIAELGWFTWFAHEAARLSGKPATFLIAASLIALWAATGSLFDYSNTWQLVVNTGTTIVTFLMVFLIQNTQNRDTLALQIKLADIIIALRGTHDNLATAENLSDADLEALHEEYRKRAETLQQMRNKRQGPGRGD